jgi:uncharacterized membrane protein YfcA
MDLLTLTLLAVVALAACTCHGAVGFGSGPLLVPVLLLVTEPTAAVAAALFVGISVNVLQFIAERRRPWAPARRLRKLWLTALPAAGAGALVAGELDSRLQAALVLIAVAGSGAALLLPVGPLPTGALAPGGVLAGFCAALTGVFGPLLGAFATAAGYRGDDLRDGIGASFVVVGTTALAATLVRPGAAGGLALGAAMLAPAVAGHALGRRTYVRLGPAGHRRAVLAAVAVGGGTALVGTLA